MSDTKYLVQTFEKGTCDTFPTLIRRRIQCSHSCHSWRNFQSEVFAGIRSAASMLDLMPSSIRCMVHLPKWELTSKAYPQHTCRGRHNALVPRRYAAYVLPASIASTCAQARRQLKSGIGGVRRWDFRVASQGLLGEDRQDGAENANECRHAVYVGAVSALLG